MLSMSRKKVFLLVVSLLLISLFSNAVSAQENNGGLGSAFDTIRQLFAFLPELITMEKLLDADPVAIFWAKFLIWLGLFAVIYFGASFPFKQNPRIAVVVALVISLMSALMIPNSIIGSIFQTYGLLAAIIVWAVPVFAGFYLAHLVPNRLARALIYLLTFIVLTLINGNTLVQDTWNIALPYFTLLWAVVLILFLWNLFAGLGELGIGGGGGGGGGGGFRFPGLGGIFRGAGDELGDAARAGRGLFGGRREPRTAEEEQRLVDEAQRVRENIENIERDLERHLRTAEELELLRQLAELIKQLDAVQTELIRLEGI